MQRTKVQVSQRASYQKKLSEEHTNSDELYQVASPTVTAGREDNDDYMESYVQTQFDLRVAPLEDDVKRASEKLATLITDVKGLEGNLEKVDRHYAEACKAICQTLGLVLKDVSAHNIQKEYQNFVEKQQEMRAKLKLKNAVAQKMRQKGGAWGERAFSSDTDQQVKTTLREPTTSVTHSMDLASSGTLRQQFGRCSCVETPRHSKQLFSHADTVSCAVH